MERPMRAFLVAAAFAIPTAVSAQLVSNDGSLSYSYGFPLPPARGHYQPTLALTYNSNVGAIAYGVGWSLSGNYIDASTQATPNANGTLRTRYTLVLNGASQLLVRAPDGSYRADVVRSYFAVTPSTASPCPSSWTAVDSLGNVYLYSSLGGAQCGRWYLTSVVDTDHNTTYFDYNLVETHYCAGQIATTALLTGIRYNFTGSDGSGAAIHQVSLSYVASASPEVRAVDGCIVQHDRLLTSVSLTRATSATTTVTLSSWTLAYSLSPDTSRERLDSIQALDRSGTALGIP